MRLFLLSLFLAGSFAGPVFAADNGCAMSFNAWRLKPGDVASITAQGPNAMTANLSPEATKRLAELSLKLIGKPMKITVGSYHVTPIVRGPITGGQMNFVDLSATESKTIRDGLHSCLSTDEYI